MIDQKTLSLEQALDVVNTAIQAAKDADHRGIAVCVVDKASEIIASARMNGLHPRYAKAAHRKAYTAAVFERDTNGVIKFWDQQAKQGHRGPADWNDPMLSTLPGGIVVCRGQDVVGGIGCAGGNQQISDWEFADIALGALGEGYRHRIDWD